MYKIYNYCPNIRLHQPSFSHLIQLFFFFNLVNVLCGCQEPMENLMFIGTSTNRTFVLFLFSAADIVNLQLLY